MYILVAKTGDVELHEVRNEREASSLAHRAAWQQVHFTYAHKWVRDGRWHNTGLWVDCDGRVRKAGG